MAKVMFKKNIIIKIPESAYIWAKEHIVDDK